MKLEKISDTQIRCTLNKEDLLDRELRLSELAYGSDKAKELFRDMMQQASYEFGFEADDIPLMIEAIPVSVDCLVLVITKVEDPDELDTRFSNFTPCSDEENSTSEDSDENAYADEILNCFEHIEEILGKRSTSTEETSVQKPSSKKETKKAREVDIKAAKNSALVKIYSFRSLREVTALSRCISSSYDGNNTLYKNPFTSIYYLVVHISNHTPEDYNKVCNMIIEYGKSERSVPGSIALFEEHYEVIIKEKAVQILKDM